MAILVTGASGFIGGELTRTLAGRGKQVRVLARSTSNLDALSHLDLDVHIGELDDPAVAAMALEGVEVVYHCAGLAADWGPWTDFERSNVTAVETLLGAAVGSQTLERFVHVSTTDVYGYPKEPGDETAPMHDVGYPYNRSKIMGEQVVDRYWRETGLPATIIRPATVFGPRSLTFTAGLARLLIDEELPLVGGGKACAGLIYIDDLVNGMIDAATAFQAVGGVYNMRDPAHVTWRDAILTLAAGLGITKPLRTIPGPIAVGAAAVMETIARARRSTTRPLLTRHLVYTMIRDQCYSVDKAKRELWFAPKTGVEQGLRLSVDWLQSPEGKAAIESVETH